MEKVIRSLRHQRDRAKSATAREVLERVLGYFRKRRHRMRYHDLRQKKLAIGSGVVEAANKTLVTKRMKCSGMRWGMAGGQAVLTFRALEKSGRFDAAWDLLRSRANRNRPSERRQATAT
ncbi:MAG: hypothetical protein OXB95_13195 [Rhodobacteraceae bacterium]|nr:hypothetical protein [Paracoccaceae bacterium]